MLKWVFLLALLFRLIISSFSYHSDVLDQLNWVKDIERYGLENFYQRDIPDAGPPNYPPLYYLIVSVNNKIYLTIKSILWKVNLDLKAFPSNIYLWFESDMGRIWFNKLLPMISDLGIGYLVYLIVKILRDNKSGKYSLLFYLFMPPSWYISSVWGQTDSIFLLFLIISIYLLILKNDNWSILFYSFSVFIKPISLFLLPIYCLWLVKNYRFLNVYKGLITSCAVIFSVHFLFNIPVTPDRLAVFYFNNIREISGYISSNAFNFWGMIYGFGPIGDSYQLLGIKLFYIALVISVIFFCVYLFRLWKTKSIEKFLFLTSLYSFSAFLFMTRMHERYFYLPYILLIIVAGINPVIRKYLLFLTAIYFINLYHYWWVPYNEVLKSVLSLGVTEISLCFINLLLFVVLNKNLLSFHDK